MTVEESGRRRGYRCHLDLWLDEVVGIEGLPIPYGAPSASPHVERFMGTLRYEALNHFIFLSADHIRRAVTEYVRYYNGARPSQAIHGIPEPYPEPREAPPALGTLVAFPVLGGVQHDYRPPPDAANSRARFAPARNGLRTESRPLRARSRNTFAFQRIERASMAFTTDWFVQRGLISE